jgi:hypothetical protein
MIWESGPWKAGLLNDARLLERWASKKNRPTQRGVIFEKKVFLAAYAIRRLFEAEKVCTVLKKKPIPCLRFPRTTTLADFLNWHRLDEHFDLAKPAPSILGVTALVNQIIHSFIFTLEVNEDDCVTRFFVASDRERTKNLFSIALCDFISLMREIGDDRPSTATFVRDPVTGQFHATNTCPIHPLHELP